MSVITIFRSFAVLAMACVSIAHAQDARKGSEDNVPQVEKRASEVGVISAPKEWVEVATRLAAIEKTLDKKAGAFEWTNIITALFGLIGVLVGSLINYWIQKKLMMHQKQLAETAAAATKQLAEKAATATRQLADDTAGQERELAEQRAKLEIGNSFVQWQLKQLSELYGPLHTLLGQSNAMYRQMNQTLEGADKERFRLTGGGDDFDKKEFEIKLKDSNWVRFRTVLHIDEVYGKHYGVEPYFDEIVAIGARIAKVIEEKAGYARPDQNELSSVFGMYLAHFAILKRLHSDRKTPIQPSPAGGDRAEARPAASIDQIKIHESAVFPQAIRGMVEKGFADTNNELKEWRAKAAT